MTAAIGEITEGDARPEGFTLAGWLRLLGDLQTLRGTTETAQATLWRSLSLLIMLKADPAERAPLYASLVAASAENGIPEALRYVQGLDDPASLSPADVIAVRSLIEVIYLARPEDPTWSALRDRWTALGGA